MVHFPCRPATSFRFDTGGCIRRVAAFVARMLQRLQIGNAVIDHGTDLQLSHGISNPVIVWIAAQRAVRSAAHVLQFGDGACILPRQWPRRRPPAFSRTSSCGWRAACQMRCWAEPGYNRPQAVPSRERVITVTVRVVLVTTPDRHP